MQRSFTVKTPLILTHELTSFLEDLRRFAAEKLAAEEVPAFMQFAEHYFSRYPMEDFVGRHLTDMFGSVYQWWHYLNNFDGDKPKWFVRTRC
jgi:glutamate dehydrogenase